jgi:hypothetical protein
LANCTPDPCHLPQAIMSLIRALPRVPRAPYLRARDLAKLLPLWPSELADNSLSAHRHIVSRLHAAVRHERRKGLGAHWDYDLNRHAALIVALRAEAAALQSACATPRQNVMRTLRRTGTRQTLSASLTGQTSHGHIASTGGKQS